MSNAYRVSYVNRIDGNRRVLIGQVDQETAKAVAAKFGNKKDPLFFMGSGVNVEPDDGTPDGEIITA